MATVVRDTARRVAGRWPARPAGADRSYDHDKYRRLVRARGITPRIARRGVEHGSGLGKIRRLAERTFAWLKGFRRLRIRTERQASIHQAIFSLACSIICIRELTLN